MAVMLLIPEPPRRSTDDPFSLSSTTEACRRSASCILLLHAAACLLPSAFMRGSRPELKPRATAGVPPLSFLEPHLLNPSTHPSWVRLSAACRLHIITPVNVNGKDDRVYSLTGVTKRHLVALGNACLAIPAPLANDPSFRSQHGAVELAWVGRSQLRHICRMGPPARGGRRGRHPFGDSYATAACKQSD